MAHAKVLVADDNPLLLRIASTRLAGEGYEVATARDGNEVLEQARRERPGLIFLDLMMPGLDGFATLKRLKSGPLASIPVVIVSALRDEDDIARALGAGAADYLTKPFMPSELIARAQVYLAPSFL